MSIRAELEDGLWEVDEDMNLYPSNIDRIVDLSNKRVVEELEKILSTEKHDYVWRVKSEVIEDRLDELRNELK